ncbi:tetratricopeptide repeat protein [bacterium]|nr:tetratricopeptide repeat protein [bacterium]
MTRLSMIRSLHALMAMLAVASLTFLGGCGLKSKIFGPDYTVPEKDSAREQAQIADRASRQAQQLVESKARREAYLKAVAAFQMVQERFPDDRVYTPAATLMEGDLYGKIEEYRRAESAYRKAIARYADIPDVHAGALLGLGESLYQQNRNNEGNEIMKQIVDTYGRSEDPAIRARVRRAELLGNRVR